MIKSLVTILLILLLHGCSTFPNNPPPVIPPNTPVNIAPDVLKECNLLNENISVVTFEDAIVAYGNLATEYGSCAGKQRTSVKVIKQLINKN